MPASAVPFMQSAGINVVAEEVENVYSKMCKVQGDSGSNKRSE